MPEATLVIRRGSPGEAPRDEAFTVEFQPGASVLDVLRMLRVERDPTLTFRYACLNANACKECMMVVNGKVTYACTARVVEGTTTLQPLPNKELVRDLVTQIAPPDERF